MEHIVYQADINKETFDFLRDKLSGYESRAIRLWQSSSGQLMAILGANRGKDDLAFTVNCTYENFIFFVSPNEKMILPWLKEQGIKHLNLDKSARTLQINTYPFHILG